MKILASFLAYLMFVQAFSAKAQIRTCATMDVYHRQTANNEALRQQYQNVFDAIDAKAASMDYRKTRAVVRIPVVVHVIHNGSPVGVGQNVSDAQIMSQLDALNEDYRKRNADSLKFNHPFYSVTADANIEFCLANRDPNGNVTTGIKRYSVNQNSITENDMDNSVKPQTIWDPSKYLNIWVCNLTGSILGYAQFPGGPSNTDGVVILYTAFGYVGSAQAPYNNGRTCVHEVGHWLGLRHIWGDDDNSDGICGPGECSGSDQVSDTRNQCERNYGAPTFPNRPGQCGVDGNGDMFMNYMDYTNDTAMVMFTKGQVNRMQAVLGEPFGGGRFSLKGSNGCQWPASVSDVPKTADVVIFPNPATTVLTIYLSEQAQEVAFSVSNISGAVMNIGGKQYVQNGTANIDVSTLPNGMYTITIKYGDTQIVKKFIKN